MRVFQIAAWGLSLGWFVAPLTARDHDDGDHGRPRVILYEHADFRGASLALEPGESLDNLAYRRFPNGEGMNDRISSIRIEGNLDVLVFQDAGFRGGMLRITHSMRNLNDEARGWNDAISSIRIEREHGHGGPPPRPDYGRCDPVIRRVYIEVLLREPDESGLRLYRGRMIDDGWSEVRLREELRRSSEYRLVVDRVITKAHRDLLGRDPDPSSRRNYSERMLRDGWSEQDVRNAIQKGDEYRRRPHPPGH